MSDKDIVRITKVDNVRIKNLHDGYLFPLQSVLEIEIRGGATRIIDLIADRDITDIDYYEVCETTKTRRKDLFKEYID